MTRILERLAFWRKKQPKNELARHTNNSASRPIPPLPPADTHGQQQQVATSFLVPDLDDIRPFVTSTSNPISMRDLLNAISLKRDLYNQLSLKSKRKRDDDQLSSIQSDSFSSWNSSIRAHNHQGTICRATHIALGSSDTPPQFKKPKLVTISSNEDIEHLASQLASSPPSIRPTSAPQPILGLPSHIWPSFPITQPHHQPKNQATNSIRPTKLLSSHLRLALEAQKNRHALIGLCKTLSPIARKAAWSTLLLGTPGMVDRIAQRFEADSHLATHVQTCIVVLLPPSRMNTAPQLDSPRGSTAARNERAIPRPSPLTPKQPSRSSHPAVRKIQNQPVQNHTPPSSPHY
ncbi:hypothetical protein PtA15_14A105 [Puccinia triticina]|uniref:Uncharacterized protein n=1 Tax=Puccinia triticina TaxID=208348 RepID=A0ABY7D0Y3_9BASI|nr:uncharacterized protein PtA15_14A105 [Puccinia triticina]WAQ91223.1 hypothetical protein PtA15_14A105 [Puccinia triticina]WAR62024.1 hypothetical protein PtB15_14B118 [Puccinia triticina]